MNGHLIAVKVGVKGHAGQRMKLNGFAFDQNRFERLDAETVKRGRSVQENGVMASDLFQNVPHFGLHPFQHPFGGTRALTDSRFISSWIMKGLNNSSAISFGNPH